MANNEEIYLLEIIHKLWSKKFFLMFCTLIPATIAMIVSFLIPKHYTASTTVLAPEVAAGGGVIQTPFGGFSTSGLGGENTISSQALIALLKSDKMLEDVVDHFNLVKVLKVEKKRNAIRFLRDEMSSIELLADEGTINISVWSYSPEMSKKIVEFYLESLEKLNQTLKLTTIYPIVKVLSPPFVPEEKSFPKTKINMAIAGLGGLICGLLFLYFKERTANIG